MSLAWALEMSHVNNEKKNLNVMLKDINLSHEEACLEIYSLFCFMAHKSIS